MSEKNKKGEEISQTIVLKPLWGLRPGIYLTVLYGIILALIIFFLLFFPGLNKPYGRMTFSSEPRGTAVRMDDVYIGSTPFTFDVPAGNHRFTFVLPGFEEKNHDIDVEGRVFASLFFPKKIHIHETMKTDDPVNAFVMGAKSFSEWSFAGEATAVFQHPMDLSNAAYRIGFVNNPDDRMMMQEILKASARFASTKTAARDLIRAKFLADNAGKALSPLSALRSIKDAAEYVSDIDGAPFWLASLLGEEHVSTIADSALYAEESGSSFTPAFGAYDNNVIRVKSLVFRKIPAAGNRIHHEQFDGDFWIAENPVTRADWDAFVNENPKWRAKNRDALIAEGLVSNAYLRDINDSRYPESIAPGISWFAAKAYCDWLSASIDDSLSNYVAQVPVGTNKEAIFVQTTKIRLPTENEWEYAALYNNAIMLEDGSRTAQIMRMMGSFWEWCEDPFVPLNHLPASIEAVEMLSSPKRAVRGGGSWADSRTQADMYLRGSLEPDTSSPFTAFRPVIVISGGSR